MSHLISRILLTVFMLPLAALSYTTVVIVSMRIVNFGYNRDQKAFVITGLMVWALIAAYWLLLWGWGVRWNAWRVNATWIGALGAAFAATAIGLAVDRAVPYGSFSYFIATAFAPLFWLVVTVFSWRESSAERVERLKAVSADAIVCPACGYNLTGLSEARCPECGAKYTLNELFAAQPAREMAKTDSEITA